MTDIEQAIHLHGARAVFDAAAEDETGIPDMKSPAQWPVLAIFSTQTVETCNSQYSYC